MFSWLKKHFIPHDGNDHQPHFLRSKNIRLLVLIIFVVELGVSVLSYIPSFNLVNYSFTASVLPSVLDDLTNQNRQGQHLAILSVNPVLDEVAQMKAKDMADKGYFAHTSPEGKTPWYWFKEAGYNYEYAGENLAVDFTDSQDVTLAWMNSPAHKANIMKNDYTEMGTGVATGTYQGNQTIFVAQVFAKPATVAVVDNNTKVANEKNIDSEPKLITGAKVMGASTEAQTNIVKDTPVVAKTLVPAPIVDSKATEIPSKATIFQKYLASPRHMANIIFIIIGSLVALAILLKSFIRMDKRHPILITNGLIVIMLIFGVFSVNNYLTNKKLATTTSFVGFHGEVFDQNK